MLRLFWLVNLCLDVLLAVVLIALWEEHREAHGQSSFIRRQILGSGGGVRISESTGPASPVITAAVPRPMEPTMDKKAKKKIDVLNQRLQKLRQQLAGAKKQMDEPGEARRLEAEIAQAETELQRLKEA